MTDDAVGVADADRRALSNATGALAVIRAASESVDDALTAIDDRTVEQSAEVAAVVEDVGELSATIEEIAASADEIDDGATEAVRTAEAGRESAERAAERMRSVRTTGDETLEAVDRLGDRLDRIEETLSGIDDIADQTNVLALNASIEAARSDGGEGFAVVAEEVKALSEASREQSDEIADTLAEVRTTADTTVDGLRESVDEVIAAADLVESAAEDLADVATTVEAVQESIASVAAATDEQASTAGRVADRCEAAADRADGIERAVAAIREERAEQTAMVEEVESTVATVTPRLDADALETVPTGIEPLDARAGGMLQGGRAVVRHEGTAAVDVVARLCAGAAAAGLAVSLTPPPGLDRGRLAAALDGRPERLLADDRLFVLDAFGDWTEGENVFDLTDASLSSINRTTVERRTTPLLVVGNVAAEVEVLGESRAREARYENDDSVFDPRDTVVNVVDDAAVDGTFGAFYAGAADQVFELDHADGSRTVRVRRSPTCESVAVALPG